MFATSSNEIKSMNAQFSSTIITSNSSGNHLTIRLYDSFYKSEHVRSQVYEPIIYFESTGTQSFATGSQWIFFIYPPNSSTGLKIIPDNCRGAGRNWRSTNFEELELEAGDANDCICLTCTFITTINGVGARFYISGSIFKNYGKNF